MKKYIIPISALAAMCMAAPMALADHDHDRAKIKRCEVDIDHKTIDVEGKVRGLDKHEEVGILLVVQGEVKGDCVNPGGHSPRPHQDKEVEFEEVEWKDFYKGHRRLEFEFKNLKPRVSAKHICPDENWTFKFRKLKLHSVEVKVFQPHRRVLSKECL